MKLHPREPEDADTSRALPLRPFALDNFLLACPTGEFVLTTSIQLWIDNNVQPVSEKREKDKAVLQPLVLTNLSSADNVDRAGANSRKVSPFRWWHYPAFTPPTRVSNEPASPAPYSTMLSRYNSVMAGGDDMDEDIHMQSPPPQHPRGHDSQDVPDAQLSPKPLGQRLFEEFKARVMPSTQPKPSHDPIADLSLYITPATQHRRQKWPLLPELYLTSQPHPLRSSKLRTGRDFVVLWHSKDTKGIEELKAWVEAQKDKLVPKGPNAAMVEQGLYDLGVGDIVWARDLDAEDVAPLHDWLQLYVAEHDEFARSWEDVVADFEELKKTIIGKPGESTIHGTKFESYGRAEGIKDTRCYPTGLNVQKAPNITGPSKGLKVTDDRQINEKSTDGDYLRTVQLINRIITPLAVCAYRTRNPELYEILDEMAELVNTPRLACKENCLFTGGQLNIALAQLYESKGEMKELGFFGGVHKDQYDAEGSLSNMAVFSNLPEGYEGGRFHFVELGVFVMLEGIKFIGFSGLRYHGGTPPLAPQGVTHIDPSAYRIVHISYPQAHVIDGKTTFNIGATSDGSEKPLQVTATDRVCGVEPGTSSEATTTTFDMEEIVGPLSSMTVRPELEHGRHVTNHICFLKDAPTVVFPEELFSFVVRNHYYKNNLLNLQLPFKVTSDYEKFRQAFTDEHGNHPYPWPLAPTGEVWKEPSLKMDWQEMNARQKAKMSYTLLCASSARFIPSRHGKYLPYIHPSSRSGPSNVNIEETPGFYVDSDDETPQTTARRPPAAKASNKKRKEKKDGSTKTIVGGKTLALIDDPYGDKARRRDNDARIDIQVSPAQLPEPDVPPTLEDEYDSPLTPVDEDLPSTPTLAMAIPSSAAAPEAIPLSAVVSRPSAGSSAGSSSSLLLSTPTVAPSVTPNSPSTQQTARRSTRLAAAAPAKGSKKSSSKKVRETSSSDEESTGASKKRRSGASAGNANNRNSKRQKPGPKAKGKQGNLREKDAGLDKDYPVKLIIGFRTRGEGRYDFLCRWLDQKYADSWVVGSNMADEEPLRRFCQRHQLGTDVRRNTQLLGNIHSAHECFESDGACLGSVYFDKGTLDDEDFDEEEETVTGVNLLDIHDDLLDLEEPLNRMVQAGEAMFGPNESEHDEEEDGENKWGNQKIAFFADLNHELIANEKAKLLSYTSPPSPKLLDDLATTCNSLIRRPYEDSTLTKAADFLPSLAAAVSGIRSKEIDEGFTRNGLMTFHSIFTRWIFDTYDHFVAIMGEPDAKRRSWLHVLIDAILGDIRTLLYKEHAHLQYRFPDFFPTAPDVTSSVPNPTHGRKRAFKDNELRPAALGVAMSVVSEFFGMQRLEYIKGLFLVGVTVTLGFGALWLKPVWSAYEHPYRLTSRRHPPTEQEILNLTRKLMKHPYSTEATYIFQMQQLRGAMVDHFTRLAHPGIPYSLSYTDTGVTDEARWRLLNFLVATITLIPGYKGPHPEHNLPADKVRASHQRPDFMLVSREYAPCRIIIKKAGGPCDPAYRWTLAQLFSLLVFRGCLYDTRALREEDHTYYFETLEEWKEYSDPLIAQYGEAYICNKRPYGTTKGRESRNVDGFWDDAKVLKKVIDDYRNEHPSQKVPFALLLNVIQKKKGLDGKKNPKLFYTFGPLVSYLFCVDLVYAGVLEKPDMNVMAEIVVKLNRGWCSAMKSLGCLPYRACLQKEFITTFEFIDANMKQEHKDILGWDIFVFEHGGCKYIRFYPVRRT
ncbi:hypothetical protein PM082_004117 [Marasmius tenuissimus]|nr:hypothetical protein PM082_004117 [Marasmius tenuissimus]